MCQYPANDIGNSHESTGLTSRAFFRHREAILTDRMLLYVRRSKFSHASFAGKAGL
jgi:hypothetical protein